MIRLDILLHRIFNKDKPVLDSREKEFIERCEFAEETGWKKIGESKKGVIYKNDFLGIKKYTIPWPYLDYNKK